MDDVRPLLKKFDGNDPFGMFEKNQRLSYEALREVQKKSMQSGIRKFLSSLFGVTVGADQHTFFIMAYELM